MVLHRPVELARVIGSYDLEARTLTKNLTTRMRQLVLDGGKWAVAEDIYDAFFQAVGAPSWHGRNFNALRDSISGGQINQVEIPYVIKIMNYESIGPYAKTVAQHFVEFIEELKKSGCPVDLEIEP
jgi:RNAse (barnase) inhibitor barstar